MYETELQHLELNMKQAKAMIDKKEALGRLTKNKDFVTVILDGYFLEEASRAVLAKADPSMHGDMEQAHLDTLITGIGALRQYFSTIERMGDTAKRTLKDNQQTKEELLQEEMSEVGAIA